MNPRLEEMKTRVRERLHASHRKAPAMIDESLANSMEWHLWTAHVFKAMCDEETPVILGDEKIAFTRTLTFVQGIAEPDWVGQKREEGLAVHGVGNITPGWEDVVNQGLLARRDVAQASMDAATDDETRLSMEAAIITIDAVLDLAKRYADQARAQGRADLADVLDHVPARAPRNFHEALQSLKFMHSVTWFSSTCHVGLGRFDQYMLPYYQADLENGTLTKDAAYDLLCEFFISLNKDTDLMPGVQQGDNGQSLMLGGVKRDGSCAVNDLTWVCMEASEDVNMIDPKINLRVDKDTDMELLKLAARLTRRGLGFPQFANDDVEIQSLVNYGYELEDARDYVVAACWEFIVPGKGIDVPNINALNFLAAADTAIRDGLPAGDDFDGIMERTRENIFAQVTKYATHYNNWQIEQPAPWYTVIMDTCLERGTDCNRNGGVKYYNCGIHGSGSANAADALAAVKKFVFDDESIERGELVNAVITDFANDEPLRQKLFNDGPKVGNNDPYVDELLTKIFHDFADACQAMTDQGITGRGTVVRPGTGSAMYYVSLVRGEQDGTMEPMVKASADGRHQGDFIGSSLAPSPGVKIRGPISVLQSFSKIPFDRICNGGPITMELSDTVFRDDDALEKVAMLIRTFAQIGCQQLQLNSLNIETLKEAKEHPEKHKNLIVRVWGWSGYFCELDECYQDHIIARHALAL
jgi:pyruvate-formate lyase